MFWTRFASVYCICSCLSRGSGQEVMVSLPLTVISLFRGSCSSYTCSILVAYFIKYFCWIFFVSGSRSCSPLALALISTSVPWSWTCCFLGLAELWSWLCLGLTWGVLDYATTTGWAKLKLNEFQNQRERVISVAPCAFTATAYYYATPYVNKVRVWCNNVLDCFAGGSLLLCFL